MNLRLLRLLDYYVGVPICLFLTIVDLFRPRQEFDENSVTNKILFVELSEMGSTILAYTALHYVQDTYSKAEIFFLTFHKNRESVELLGLIDKKHTFTIRDDNLITIVSDTLRFIINANRYRISVVVDLELFSRFSTILSYISGAHTRIGFHSFRAEGLYRGNLLTHKVQYSTYYHMVYNFLALAYSLSENPKEIPHLKKSLNKENIRLPKFEFNSAYIHNLESSYLDNRKTVIINPDSGPLLPLRNWDIECFAKVTLEILDRCEANVVLVGEERSASVGEYISRFTNDSEYLVNMIGATSSISQLIHVIQSGDVFLTCDSGPAHFAALTATPTIVLFGPETPDMYSSLSSRGTSLYSHYFCSPCLTARNHRNSPCLDNRCMKEITPQQVIQEVEKWLET